MKSEETAYGPSIRREFNRKFLVYVCFHCFAQSPHDKRQDARMKSGFLAHSPLAAQPAQALPASSVQPAPAAAIANAAPAAPGADGGAGLSKRDSNEEEKSTVSLR